MSGRGKGGKGLGKGGAVRHREVLDKARVAYGVKDFKECYEITSALVRSCDGKQLEEVSELYFKSLEACRKSNRDALRAIKELEKKKQLSPEVVESYKARYEEQIAKFCEDGEEMIAIYFKPNCKTSQAQVNLSRMQANSLKDHKIISKKASKALNKEILECYQDAAEESRGLAQSQPEGVLAVLGLCEFLEETDPEAKELVSKIACDKLKAAEKEMDTFPMKNCPQTEKAVKRLRSWMESRGMIPSESNRDAREEVLAQIRAHKDYSPSAFDKVLEEIRELKPKVEHIKVEKGGNEMRKKRDEDTEKVLKQIKALKRECSPSAREKVPEETSTGRAKLFDEIRAIGRKSLDQKKKEEKKRSMDGKKNKSRDLAMYKRACASCGVTVASPSTE